MSTVGISSSVRVVNGSVDGWLVFVCAVIGDGGRFCWVWVVVVIDGCVVGDVCALLVESGSSVVCGRWATTWSSSSGVPDHQD